MIMFTFLTDNNIVVSKNDRPTAIGVSITIPPPFAIIALYISVPSQVDHRIPSFSVAEDRFCNIDI